MSDFIFSKKPIHKGQLSKEIQAIYHEDCPTVKEFHGEWGSLAVSDNLYHGFKPYETDEHICVVVGGPLLCFQDQQVMESLAGTKVILERMLDGLMKWDEDLSGPFAIFFGSHKKKFIRACFLNDVDRNCKGLRIGVIIDDEYSQHIWFDILLVFGNIDLDLESPVVGIDDLGYGVYGEVEFLPDNWNADMNLVISIDPGYINFRKIDLNFKI